MSKEAPEMSTEEEARLLDRLPWYVNGTLDASERSWVAECLLRSSRARTLLAREQDLAEYVESQGVTATDHGLAGFVEKLQGATATQAATQAVAAPAAVPGASARLALADKVRAWTRWLSFPQLAGAMAVVIVLQFTWIGWELVDQSADHDQTRSIPVAEMRTLRVSVLPTTTELQFRRALIAASARLIGGPNQYGEYWIASPVVSVDEMTAILRKTGLFEQITPDTKGPLPVGK